MAKSIVLAGFGEPLKLVLKSIKDEFNIIGIIKDYDRIGCGGEEFESFLNENKIEKFKLQDLKKLKPDVLFSINFNKIIDIKYLEGLFALNLHIGLLPKYRGNNANSWAILNGERIVGYSIHEIIQELDAGDVFYKFQYDIKDGETYFEAKTAINKDIENIKMVLNQILDGTLKRESQSGCEFIYASHLVQEDGFISSWENIKSEDVFNKYVVFAKPLGTGLKFYFKGNNYYINKISKIPGFADSIGINGAVVMKTAEGSIWVKTKDNAVSIDELSIDDNIIMPSDIFRIGDRL